MNTITTLIIVEKNEIIRAGVRNLLSADPELVILGEAASPQELFRRVLEQAPDILLLGLNPPKEETLEILKQVRSSSPRTHPILLADQIPEPDLLEFMKAGVKGSLPTCATATALKKALQAVVGGEYWVGRKIFGKLFSEELWLGDPYKSFNPDTTLLTNLLTKREREIVKLLSQGCKNKEIADRLVISEKTVKTHLAHVFPKLKIHSRLQAVLHINGHLFGGRSFPMHPLPTPALRNTF